MQVVEGIATAIASVATGNWSGLWAALAPFVTTDGEQLVACVCDEWPTVGNGSGSAGAGSGSAVSFTYNASYFAPMPIGVKTALVARLVPGKKLIHPAAK